MKFLRTLFKLRPGLALSHPEVFPTACGSYANGADLDIYYSALLEDRPYVRAMREVACDQFLSA